MRLLYVALTRAADRLIVSGVEPKAKKDGSDPRPPSSWHRDRRAGAGSLGAEPVEGRWGRASPMARSRRCERPRNARRSRLPPMRCPTGRARPRLSEARPPRPLAPSAIAVDDEAAAAAERSHARGGPARDLIHQLLERLLAVEPDERRGTALRWLEALGGRGRCGRARRNRRPGLRSPVRPRLSRALFGPDSLGEAPLAATLPDGRVIAGTVDRLLVEAERVSVIDFKTGRVPRSEADIPASHRAQMAAYADALRVIFPGRSISAALLYTAGPQLFELARLRAAGRAPICPLTFSQESRRHGHQDRHRPELCHRRSRSPTSRSSSISGRNGAARAG